MLKLFAIGSGGFFGALFRYWISGWAYRLFGTGLPYGTLIVNVLGSFILGFFLFYSEGRTTITPAWRSFFAIGMMGALTTFSTFSYETFMLIMEKLYVQSFLNITLNLALTLIAVWAGMMLSKFV